MKKNFGIPNPPIKFELALTVAVRNTLEIQKKWKFAQKSQILWGEWISGWIVHKSADYWNTQFFLFSQKFHDQYFFPNCDLTEPGTTFLKICLDSAYSIDSKNGLTFENR